MKYFIIAILFYTPSVFGQKIEDSKIIISLKDNNDIYRKVKIALINADFIVKDNYNVDTLTTYAREFTDMAGHCVIFAIIVGNSVTLNGFYSLKKQGLVGFPLNTNNFQKVLYYKSSKSWDLLQKVAEGIGGQITYSK